ncbi:MAG TPA: ABC transporter substrate-binding protein [Patescibacteria group bacterium]|nr:ABC transporter substrate-binding protein [Patescibacteria group bacterium]
MKALLLRLSLLLLVLGMALPAHAEDEARQTIQQFSDSLLDVMTRASQLGFHGREELMRAAVLSAYDMPEMTKATLGPSARKLTQQQLDQLTEAFTRYTAAIYAEQFDGYGGERFEVSAPRPSADGAVVVPCRIVSPSAPPTQIDYLMRQDQGHWRIVDVLLDGTVSQVAVRRSEFVTIYRRDGFPGLIEMLDHQTASMGSK